MSGRLYDQAMGTTEHAHGVPASGGAARAGADGVAGAQAWVLHAEQALASAGHRRGGARDAVLALLGGESCALTALQMEERLRTARRAVSRASIYRVLDELEGLGLVQRVETGQAMVRYERASAGEGEHHHHLVCERCGAVTPFTDPALERAISSISERVPLQVSEHEIVLRGACEDCAAA